MKWIDDTKLREFYETHKLYYPQTNPYILDKASKEESEKIKNDLLSLPNTPSYLKDNAKDYRTSFAYSTTELVYNLVENFKDDFPQIVFVGVPHENIRRLIATRDFKKVVFFETEVEFMIHFPEVQKSNTIIYFTTTSYNSGEVYDASIVIDKIKTLREKNPKTHFKVVFDSVQDLFTYNHFESKESKDFIPDYTLFTAHAIIINFDMGVCFSYRENPLLGYSFKTMPQAFIETVKKIIPFKDVTEFQKAVYKAFSKAFEKGLIRNNIKGYHSAPHIFTVMLSVDNREKLNEYAKEFCNKNRFLLRFPDGIMFKLRYMELVNCEYPQYALELFDRLLDKVSLDTKVVLDRGNQ